jgi:hypothetical protein
MDRCFEFSDQYLCMRMATRSAGRIRSFRCNSRGEVVRIRFGKYIYIILVLLLWHTYYFGGRRIPPPIADKFQTKFVVLRTEYGFIFAALHNLNGTVPEELGSRTELEVVDFHGNELVGTLPASFGDLDRLEILRFSSNDYTGTIPKSYGVRTPFLDSVFA